MSGESARRRGEELVAAGDPQSATWLAGAEGERRVARELDRLPSSWTVIHDRLLMPGLAESNIDHIVIGPAGLVMVDAKNYSGDIGVWGDSLYQHLGQGAARTSRNLAKELRKVHWMATQMAQRLAMPVTPVLCLAGNRHRRFGQAQLVAGVWVVSLDWLARWMLSLPVRIADAGISLRLIPRVLSEFPSTETDPELLAAIGRDLARTIPTRPGPSRPAGRSSRPRDTTRRPVGRRRRHPLAAMLVLTVGAGVLTGASTVLPAIGQHLGSLYESRVRTVAAQPPPTVATPAVTEEPVADEPQPVSGDCNALSASILSTYLKVPVWAAHEERTGCRWLTDPSDPTAAVVTVEWLSERQVAHLSADTVRTTRGYDVAVGRVNSVLLARPDQWIPVADIRTKARWPMRVTIADHALGITHRRADQILRAVAADLNQESAVP